MHTRVRMNQRGGIGIGAMILFIAMVHIAGITTSLYLMKFKEKSKIALLDIQGGRMCAAVA